MYFFSDRKLARDLHKGIVTEKEQLVYLLIATFICAIFLTTTMSYGPDSQPLSLYSYLADIIYLTVTLAAIIQAFKKNQSGDGKDFIVRYICLSAPITIKVTIFAFILGMLAFFIDFTLYAIQNPEVAEALQNESNITSNIFSQAPLGPGYLSVISIIALYYYWRYISAFKIASGQKEYK